MERVELLEYEEKNSRFIAILFSLDSEEDRESCLKYVEENYSKPAHVLFALALRNKFGALVYQSSEDREPVSSMAKIRRLFEKKGIEGKAVYIVRYYGGKKLGASRLDHVYFALASKLLEAIK